MRALKQQFKNTVDFAQSANSGIEMNNDQKLKVYALYKQATEGDVAGSKPGRMKIIARTKYIAREAYKGVSTDDAMQAYIDFIEGFKA